MFALSVAEIEEVNGATSVIGAVGSCVALGSQTGRVGALFGPQVGAGAALAGCAIGVGLYFYG